MDMDAEGVALAETLSAAFGRNIPAQFRPDGSGFSVNLTNADLARRRPGTIKLRRLRGNLSEANTFLSENENSINLENRITACGLLRERGDELCKQEKYEGAKLQYENATKALLGNNFIFPLPITEGLQNEVYTKLSPWERIALMECCNSMAQCMIKLRCLGQASKLECISFIFP